MGSGREGREQGRDRDREGGSEREGFRLQEPNQHGHGMLSHQYGVSECVCRTCLRVGVWSSYPPVSVGVGVDV